MGVTFRPCKWWFQDEAKIEEMLRFRKHSSLCKSGNYGQKIQAHCTVSRVMKHHLLLENSNKVYIKGG